MKRFPEYFAVAGICVLLVSGVPAEEKADVPAGTGVKPEETVKPLEITGQVRILRNESDYKIKEINVVCDGGKVYGVMLDQNGRKLAKILKSRIVKISGEMRDVKDKSFLVVHTSEIVGSAKKVEAPVAVGVVAKIEPKAVVKLEEKPEINVEAKPEAKIVDVNTAANPSTNIEAVVEVKIDSKSDAAVTNEALWAETGILPQESIDSVPVEDRGMEAGTNAVAPAHSNVVTGL